MARPVNHFAVIFFDHLNRGFVGVCRIEADLREHDPLVVEVELQFDPPAHSRVEVEGDVLGLLVEHATFVHAFQVLAVVWVLGTHLKENKFHKIYQGADRES